MINLRFRIKSIAMIIRILGSGRTLLRCRRGSVAITIGILMTVLMGMVALGTEVTFVHYKHRQMQSVADTAALSAASVLSKGVGDYIDEGRAIAASAGLSHGVNGVTVTVNNPPVNGIHAGDKDAVEVIIQQPQSLKLASLFSDAAFNVTARSVVKKGAGGSGNNCVLATDTSSGTAVSITNGVKLNFNKCGLAANATGPASISASGGAKLDAQSVTTSGKVEVSNSAKINATDGIKENQSPTSDPYADVKPVVPTSCNNTNKTLNWGSGVQILTPGTYCNGLTIQNSANAIMLPGIYYIKSGEFNLSGGATLDGTGVTIVLTKNGSKYATAQIGNGTKVTLSAPKTGITAGMVFYSDRNAPNSSEINFNGGASMTLTGALYFPSQKVIFSNGSDNSSSCTQLIGWRIEFVGGAKFDSNCEGTGTSTIGGGSGTNSALVE